jgi:DNA helicase-2/ATP-dependent DNA helicase PcrA
VDAERILGGLNAEQRAAAEATRGPVCILAGAGTGKTTTITRRIAWQVASGAFEPSALVAVTFTDKAAGELRSRLAALGVEGVRASTFHSAALALLRRFQGDPGKILSTKALLLRRIGNGLPMPYKFRPAGDLATEIEWAKNRRLTPETYLAGLGAHEPPIPADLSLRVFREYERRKAEAGAIDFEDLLGRAIAALEDDEQALATVRARWQAFTVDEYQDVNLLQQTLLDLWLGERDDVCVVGDDYQSIYSFTGASAQWLLALPRRFPSAHVVSSRTTARRRRCSGSRTGSSRSSEARRRPCGRRSATARSRSSAAAARRTSRAGSSPSGCARSCRPASRTRSRPCSCGRMRARPTSRRRSTMPGSPSRARRSLRATRPAA